MCCALNRSSREAMSTAIILSSAEVLLSPIYTSALDLRRKLYVGFHLYFCVVIRVNVQYTCGPLVYSVHGHVTGVTRSTTAKPEEEAARWRSIIAITAANKYKIITLNHYLKLQKRGQQRNRRWRSFNIHKDVYHGRSTLLVANNNWFIML